MAVKKIGCGIAYRRGPLHKYYGHRIKITLSFGFFWILIAGGGGGTVVAVGATEA